MNTIVKKIICITAAIMLLAMAAVLPTSAVENRHFVEAKEIKTAPTLDGVITEAEWGSPIIDAAYTDPAFFYSSTLTAEQLPSNIKFYVCWDAENLYIGAQITDPKHANPHKELDIWYGDSLEIDICVSDTNQASRWRTNTGLSSVDNKVYSYVYNQPNMTFDGMIGDNANRVNSDYAGHSAAALKDNVVTYELVYPWNYYDIGNEIKDGHFLLVNFMIYIADGSLSAEGTSFPGTTYLGSLTYATKDNDGSTLFPLVKLVGDTSSTTEAATAEPVATVAKTTAATTEQTTEYVATTGPAAKSGCASEIAILPIGLVAASAGALVIRRKRK